MTAATKVLTPADHVMTRGDYALYAVVVFAWGTSWIGLRLQLGVVAPEVSILWRYLMAAAIMLLWARLAGVNLIYPAQDHVRFFLTGVFAFSMNFVLMFYAGYTVTSGLLAVVFSMTAMINPLLALIVFGERPSARLIGGAVLGVTGVGLMFWPEIFGSGFSREMLAGLSLAVLATLLFAIGNTVSTKNHLRKVPVVAANAWGMVYGCLTLLVASLARGHDFIIDPTVGYIGSLIWLAIVSSVIAFASYVTLIGRIGAGRAGYATVLFPVIALAISTVFEDYTWTLTAGAGFVCVILGNLLVLGPRRPRVPLSR
ncbi:MAG: DMT family transporter [Pseudomonadota bacterium]